MRATLEGILFLLVGYSTLTDGASKLFKMARRKLAIMGSKTLIPLLCMQESQHYTKLSEILYSIAICIMQPTYSVHIFSVKHYSVIKRTLQWYKVSLLLIKAAD